MPKEGSVAPQERVNITYKPATGGAASEVELPLKMLFVGDYTGRPDETPVEDRKPVDVNKDNFQQVLAAHNLALNLVVPNTLSDEANAETAVQLKIRRLSDFGPEAIAEQVPELKKLLELRQALSALKAPLGNIPAFRKKIQALVGDAAARERLLKELGVEEKEGK